MSTCVSHEQKALADGAAAKGFRHSAGAGAVGGKLSAGGKIAVENSSRK